VLDIGSGSGCIAIEIAKKVPEARVLSVDISQNALKIAKKNACNIGVSDRVSFLESDIFSNVFEKFDIIVSNPPYIPLSEKENLQTEVRNFEPHSALFTEDKDGIDFYKKIIEKSCEYLKKGGYVAFELGINQAGIVKELFIKNNFSEVKIINDLDGIERVILAKSNLS
jgi:release factor glutamine methyltransferase